MKNPNDIKFKVANDVLWRWEGNNIIINYIGDNLILKLDPISSKTWIKIAEQGKTFGETAKELNDEFKIENEVINTNLTKLVSDFIKRGVLIQKEWTPDSSGRLINAPGSRDNVTISAPLIVDLIITWNCNLNCIHCLYQCSPGRLSHMPLEKAYNLIDQLSELNVFTLSVNGGEARLHPNFWDILKYASDKGLHIVITSNGTSFSKEDIQKLSQYNMACIRFSLDSVYPKKHDEFRGKEGTFDKVMQCIKWAKSETGIQTNILSTISKMNYDEIDLLIELAVEHKVDAINLFPMVPEGRASLIKDLAFTKQEFKDFLIKIDKIKKTEKRIKILTDSPLMITLIDDNSLVKQDLRVCPAGIISCSVTPEGDLFPCPYFPTPVGNVFNSGFKEIWDSSKFLKELRNEQYLDADCKLCSFKNSCRGGCRALSYTYFGSISKADPFCWRPKK